MTGDARNIEETQRRIWYRQLNWTVHADIARRHFETVAREALNDKYFEFLYVTQDKGERQLQLFAGAHPVGTVRTIWDGQGGLRRERPYVEKGAALAMSQSIRGEVAVFLYPYESEKHGRKEKLIVWGVFDDPAKLTDARLRRMTKDFFTYVRVSSVHFTASFSDNLRINWLVLRSHRYDEQGLLKLILSHPMLLALGLLGSLASIWSLAQAFSR